MRRCLTPARRVLIFFWLVCLPFAECLAMNPLVTSTREQAISFVNSISKLEPSNYWPAIKPELFLQNLKTDANEPMSIYQGRGTNFCGYGALTYLFLQDDPLGYVKMLLDLYRNGTVSYGRVTFNPSEAIRNEAGQLKYRGILDIRPAEQMWFLTLADHFKGYLNIFNRKYDSGDEETFWASVNYAKFNRMIRSLLHYKARAWGSDLIRPRVESLYDHIAENLKNGPVILYINNRIVHKKNHVKIKLAIPTHFIAVQQITKTADQITLVYWDYGGKTLFQLSPAFLKKITFGITCCTKNTTDGQ